jgi:hypothetical protein
MVAAQLVSIASPGESYLLRGGVNNCIVLWVLAAEPIG